jgi:hypothetical protein
MRTTRASAGLPNRGVGLLSIALVQRDLWHCIDEGTNNQNKIASLLATYNVTALEFRSFQLSYGALIFCVSLFCFVFFNGMMTKFSVTRYFVISNFCHSDAVTR